MRILFALTVGLIAAAAACGSSEAGKSVTGASASSASAAASTGSAGGAGAGGAGVGGATASGTTTTTTNASNATSASASSGGGVTCYQNCIQKHPAGFQKFQSFELTECGCSQGKPCFAMCTAECADPSKLNQDSDCGKCLLGEASKGQSSNCTASAGGKCFQDSTCQPFLQCVLGC